MIKFIGFKWNKGEFVPDGQTEALSFNSRELLFETDEGMQDNQYGLSILTEKIKADVLAQYFGIQPNDNQLDAKVNTKLGELFGHNIAFDFGPVKGKVITVGIRSIQK